MIRFAMFVVVVMVSVSASACVIGDESDAVAPSGGDEGGAGQGEVFHPDPDVPAPAAGKEGFVLAHGFGGSQDSFDLAIVGAITAQGHAVLRDNVPGIESVAVRAAVLGQQIDAFIAATGVTRVHVIGHSMGGLDARYAISRLGYASKVASLTTVSTPHRGSPLADLALGITTSAFVSQQEALDAIVSFVGGVDVATLERALVDLSEAAAPAFNAATPDAPAVRYRSYAGLSTPNGISNPNAAAACGGLVPDPDQLRGALLLAAPIVARGTAREPGDGVVGVASGRWGVFEGCIAADHLDETSAAARPEEGVSADMVKFYAALAARLAAS